MTEEASKYWTPKGERRAKLANLQALSVMVDAGRPPSQMEITKYRKKYLEQYLKFKEDDSGVIELLEEEWTVNDLQQRYDELNSKI